MHAATHGAANAISPNVSQSTNTRRRGGEDWQRFNLSGIYTQINLFIYFVQSNQHLNRQTDLR